MSFPDRHLRNAGSIDDGAARALAAACVAVVGCGGLGGYAIELLARMGIGHFVVVDGDVFEETNLNRQLLCTEATVGRGKAACAADRVLAIDSSIDVRAVEAFLDEGNAARILAGCDCVVDCLDSPGARLVLSRACAQLGIPIAYGSIGGWYGQAAAVFPGDALYEEIFAAAARGDAVSAAICGDADCGAEGGSGVGGAMPDDGAGADGSRTSMADGGWENGRRTATGASPLHRELGSIAPACACVASYQAALAFRILVGAIDAQESRSLLAIDVLAGTCDELPLP